MNRSMLPRPRFWAEAGLQKRTMRTLLGETLMFFLVFFLAATVQGLLAGGAASVWMLREHADSLTSMADGINDLQTLLLELMESMPDWLIILILFTYAAMGAAALLYCGKIEKRKPATLGLTGKDPWQEIGLGLGIGLLMMAGVVGIGTAVGAFQPGQAALGSIDYPLLLMAFLGCIVQGASEELMFRGYLAPSVNQRFSVLFTVLFSSALSMGFGTSAQVYTTVGTINSFLFALVLCVYAIKRGSLWGACALHGMWIFAHNYLFGFYYETAEGLSVIPVRLDSYRSAITGDVDGPKAGICATIILIAALAAILATKAKDPAEEPPVPEAAG